MAAEILLEINGHKYNASGFSYDFYQVPDFKGKPVTGIKGGDIHVVLDSSYDNSILETMLSDKTRKVSYVPWEEYEPCPISGKIQLIQDGVHVFRELAFEEAYITRYKEKMDANGYPMSILLTISTLRLDINKFVRMDRRPETTYGFGWVKLGEFKEKKFPKNVIKPDEKRTPECTVYFRRNKDYDGSFGFDWLRVGDTEEVGCKWYRNSMYDISSYDNMVASEYKCFIQNWREKNDAYKATSHYIIPWVTLMKEHIATFRIKMEVNKPSGILDVKVIGNGADALSVNLKKIEAEKTGDYYYNSLLEVKCNSDFSGQTAIEVRAKDELVGKMIFIPNNKSYHLDIAIVTVKTKTLQGQIIFKKPSGKILEEIKKLLQQAFIIPHFKFYDLDLSQLAECKDISRDVKEVVEIERILGREIAPFRIKKDIDYPLFNILWDNGNAIYTNKNYGTKYFGSIHEYLNKKLYYDYKAEKQVLESIFKIYFFNETIFSGTYVAGVARPETKSACISDTGYKATTITHELLHLLSLEHPFVEGSKYLFKKSSTENLMDYDEDENSIDDRKSLWYWQIRQIWKQLK